MAIACPQHTTLSKLKIQSPRPTRDRIQVKNFFKTFRGTFNERRKDWSLSKPTNVSKVVKDRSGVIPYYTDSEVFANDARKPKGDPVDPQELRLEEQPFEV
jgi:hypothetical protein